MSIKNVLFKNEKHFLKNTKFTILLFSSKTQKNTKKKEKRKKPFFVLNNQKGFCSQFC